MSTIKRAMAIGCHPDDIEFNMAGTLLMLQKAGYEIHYMNIASGSLGTNRMTAAECARVRREESMEATRKVGFIYHESITDDLEVFYNAELFGRLVPEIRDVKPEIILTHGPYDYMEDHVNAGRLAVSAAFCRGMTNAKTSRPCADKVFDDPIAVYHSMPHALTDSLCRPVIPGMLVNVESVLDKKKEMLCCHRSQKEWLDVSQGMNAYLDDMVSKAEYAAHFCSEFNYAEGLIRHNPLGFCAADFNPIKDVLGADCVMNTRFDDVFNVAQYFAK